MYYDFYHLKQNPFAEAPDPEFLFLSRSHKTALYAIICGLEAHQGLMAIFGAAGLGKTTILQVMQERIQQQLGQTIWLVSSQSSGSDALTMVSQACGLAGESADPATLYSRLQQTLLQGRKNGWRVVLIIDDAHQIPVPTLESALWLSDLRTPTGEPLLPIVLAGLPALQDTLNLTPFRPLKKRLAVRVSLTPLTAEESLMYIRHRLTKVLMPEDALFTAGALKRVMRAARGNPRALNTLCTKLLIVGALRQQRPISAAVAREMLADSAVQNSRTAIRWGRTITTGLLLGVGLWWGWQAKRPVQTPPPASQSAPAEPLPQATVAETGHPAPAVVSPPAMTLVQFPHQGLPQASAPPVLTGHSPASASSQEVPNHSRQSNLP